MSKLRPECSDGDGNDTFVCDETALYLIRDAVFRRRSLIRGRLHDHRGRHCAMGAFWADNPRLSVSADLVDEVAAVNDSLPPSATPKERWKKVTSWLRWKLRVLEKRK